VFLGVYVSGSEHTSA